MKTTLNRFGINYNRINNIKRNEYEDFYDEMFFNSSLKILYRSKTVKDKLNEIMFDGIEIEEFDCNKYFVYTFSYPNGIEFHIYSNKQIVLY